MKYKRNWPCGICGRDVILNLDEETISCVSREGEIYPRPPCRPVPFPRYDRNNPAKIKEILKNYT